MGHEELCRCVKAGEGYSHEDMSWCADWFSPHDFEEDRDDDHDDDHHHDDHYHDDYNHGDRDVPVFEFNVKEDAVEKNTALAKFDSLKGKAKEVSARFLHKKLAEQQKLAREQKK